AVLLSAEPGCATGGPNARVWSGVNTLAITRNAAITPSEPIRRRINGCEMPRDEMPIKWLIGSIAAPPDSICRLKHPVFVRGLAPGRFLRNMGCSSRQSAADIHDPIV